MTAPGSATAVDLYASLMQLDRELVSSAQTAWFAMAPARLQESFVAQFVPTILPKLIAAQAKAAALGSRAVARTVEDQRKAFEAPPLPPLPKVAPRGFSGVASDGRQLPELLAQPLIQTYVNLDAGVSSRQALDSGFDSMDRILTTQVQDAGRMGQSVQMVVHRVTYYIRQVEPLACDRCLLLSGRHYKTNKGFLRHPHCRCVHIPGVSEYLDPADGTRGLLHDSDVESPWKIPDTRSPRQLFDGLTPAQQDRTFTIAGAKAIRAGADVGRVVNARSGMSTASVGGRKVQTTTVGTSRRNSRTKPRLAVEEIYRVAKGDPAEELRLLMSNGYITEASFAAHATKFFTKA